MAFTLTDTILLRMCAIKSSARNTSWRSRRVTTFTRDARSASGGPRRALRLSSQVVPSLTRCT